MVAEYILCKLRLCMQGISNQYFMGPGGGVWWPTSDLDRFFGDLALFGRNFTFYPFIFILLYFLSYIAKYLSNTQKTNNNIILCTKTFTFAKKLWSPSGAHKNSGFIWNFKIWNWRNFRNIIVRLGQKW